MESGRDFAVGTTPWLAEFCFRPNEASSVIPLLWITSLPCGRRFAARSSRRARSWRRPRFFYHPIVFAGRRQCLFVRIALAALQREHIGARLFEMSLNADQIRFLPANLTRWGQGSLFCHCS